MKTYNIQCFQHGHCGVAGEGHPLFDKCVEREAKGFLDALCVNNDPENCGGCAEQQRRLDREDLSFWDEQRTPGSLWYECSLTPEELARRDVLLNRLGIKKVCWFCASYYSHKNCEDGCPWLHFSF